MYTIENIKYHVALISKKLRIEETSDYVPTYYYDYKIKFHETNKFYFFVLKQMTYKKILMIMTMNLFCIM